jgi:hypothetical protein
MKRLMMLTVVAGALAAGMWSVASAQGDDSREADNASSCRLKTLRGSYLFAASGFNIAGGVAQPKAIHEVLEFNGDGTLAVPSVSLSVNGTISHPPAGTGDYTLEADCTGTLVFTGGPSFDIVAAPNGRTLWMFQTNPNTVFQGEARRFDR